MTPAQQLGPYRLIERIGRGGMGEVWKARDTRLDREVAIKLSAEQFTDRFEREARAIAALNHPNICTLFDVGPNYLVMELIEGPTLADRIAEGPIPLEESLAIARQIADALEAAHEKNIVHRDLKPANIKLRPDGSVKVLDFGLAKASGPETTVTGDSPTMLHTPTQIGVILGTAAYMAPEQARGKNVDKRADLWSFGVVLHEMLTGKRMFEGEDLTDTLASVVKSDPDLTVIPHKVRRLLAKCLQKDPKKRLRDIGDAWDYLDDSNIAATAMLPSRISMGWWCFGAALVALALVYFREKPPESPAVRFTFEPEGGMTVANAVTPPAVSPDGKRIVFQSAAGGKSQLWVRSVDSLEARPLAGTDGGTYPFWAPDSKSIGFTGAGKLERIDAAGGPITTIADNASQGGSWGDGVIVFEQSFSAGLKQIPATGGPVRDATRTDPKISAQRFPHFLPDGKHFVYLANASAEQAWLRIGTISTDGKPPREDPEIPDPVDSFAEYSQGSLLYTKGNALVARPFDLRRLAFTGEPMVLAEEVRHSATLNVVRFSASESGVLVYQGGSNKVQLASFDRSGKRLAIFGEPADAGGVRISPSDKAVAFTQRDPGSGNRDVWLLDLARGAPTRFTFDPAPDDSPLWSPDGRTVVFRSFRNSSVGDLYAKPADGSKSEVLVLADKLQKSPNGFSKDGKYMAYVTAGPGTHGSDIWILPDPLMPAAQRGDASKPYPFLQSEFNEVQGHFSPDGHWLAYVSDESGRNEVYVTAFPGPGAKHQVSSGGGGAPRWRGDGKELLFTSGRNVMTAEVETKGTTFEVGKVAKLFQLPDQAAIQDISADAQTVFALVAPDGEKPQPFTVVVNWPAALKK